MAAVTIQLFSVADGAATISADIDSVTAIVTKLWWTNTTGGTLQATISSSGHSDMVLNPAGVSGSQPIPVGGTGGGYTTGLPADRFAFSWRAP
jgi:hypothetical protein